MSLTSDDRLQKVNDPLLSRGRAVELAAHLGEPLVDMSTEIHEILPKIHEILSKGVEAYRRGLAKISELTAELADVSVGGSSQHTSGGSVLFTRPYACCQVVYLMLKRGDACLEIAGLHGVSLRCGTGCASQSRT
jgi:hypothetical protein